MKFFTAYQGKVGTKRSRLLLMRQPRVKKDPEPGSHLSPDSEPGSPRIVQSPHQQQVTPILNLPCQSSIEIEKNTSNQNLLTMTTNLSTNLLTVPQPSYLVKQHSHPLLPSQQQSSTSNYTGWIQRQHSNPEYPGRTSSPSMSIDQLPRIKIEGGHSEGKDGKDSSMSGLRIIPAELLRSSSTPQMSSSSSSESRLREGISDQRLGHCPVQRPGPALGCNHCWNTVDAHGRTLRRKTKYHCPECQINLCIVPCFQEFHERPRDNSIVKTLPKTSSI